ncbi:hypothetical protein CesoFtcFv8_026955 [Champsocephalus esox]|uniref:Uncharacterized protein n=1 Tax=Champsocephalus esox TaxID=159716 RepID=A0AAN8GA44_9TELE|nr:hypothetical protein CesoFtcFv8_026955 [Champsocephalus esox]
MKPFISHEVMRRDENLEERLPLLQTPPRGTDCGRQTAATTPSCEQMGGAEQADMSGLMVDCSPVHLWQTHFTLSKGSQNVRV